VDVEDVHPVDLMLLRVVARKRCAASPNQHSAENVVKILVERAREFVGEECTAIERSLAMVLAVLRWDSHSGLVTVGEVGGQVKLERAPRRFEDMAKTLARVQKLRLPSVQVNIGQNQIINP
jgi:hypothetical protein